MHAFSRFASIVVFVLSLSLLSCAAPTLGLHGQQLGKLRGLAVRGHHEGAGNVKVLLGAIVDLKAKVAARADAFGEAQAEINLLIADIELCSNTIASLTNLNVDAKMKANIAAHVLVIIRGIIKICLSLSAKFGTHALLDLFAKLDLCLKVLLRGLDTCMNGFLVVLGKLLVQADMQALIDAKLIVCNDLFVLIRAAVGIIA